MITATPADYLHGRVILLHFKYATDTLSIPQAEEMAIELAWAVERARDATPLHTVVSKMVRTISNADLLKELGL